jgi:Tfp pilus assembly protein PilF
LQTLREYGQEKLAEQETAETIHQRHAYYYLELAEQIAQLPTANQLDSFASIHDNLRTALAWAAGRNNNDFGLSLCAALANFWENRGYIHEGRRWLKQFLEMPGNLQPVHKAAGLLAAGILALRQAEFATALTYYKESLAIWQTLDEPKQMARTLLYLGILARRDAKEDKSRDLFDQSLAIYRQIGEQNGIATVLKNLGNVSLDDGDLLSARSLYEECLTIERSLGNLDKIASVLNNLGLVAYGLGDVAASQQLHTEALAIRRQLAIKPGIGQSLNNLGRVLLHQKEYASSDQVQHEALSLFTELGYKISIVELIESLGLLAAFQGKPAQTARFLAFALKWREQLYSERDPIYEDVYQQAVTLAQSQMESAMWQMAWIEGEIMAWDTAVSQAHQSKT